MEHHITIHISTGTFVKAIIATSAVMVASKIAAEVVITGIRKINEQEAKQNSTWSAATEDKK
jgi:P pilus assembly chaperone PapD